MPAQKKLKPGQPGTKKLVEEDGSRLLCVRYRCDPETQAIVKTIELVVEESDYSPRPRRIRDDQMVGVRIGYKEFGLQREVKSAGANWNPNSRLWDLRYDQVLKLGLEERVEQTRIPNTRKSKIPGTRN